MRERTRSAVASRIYRSLKLISSINVILIFILLISLLITLCASASAQSLQDNATNYWNEKADYWFKRGFESAGSGSYEEALRDFDKALQLNPENAGAWNGRALALRSLSLSKHDLDKYSESLKASDKAIGMYDKAIEMNPQDVNAWYYKGLALNDKAITIQSGESLNISGDKQEKTRCFEEAVSAYEKVTEINPKYVTAWKNKGNVLYSLGKYNESIQACDKAIEIVPKYGLAWYSKGLVLYKMGKYEEAVSAYDKATEMFPENADIWYDKANALYSMGNYDAAIECYDRSLKLKQSFADAWHGKGAAFERIGFQIGANAAFAKADDLGYNDEL